MDRGADLGPLRTTRASKPGLFKAARAVLAAFISTCALSVLAHHSFAMFDMSKEVVLQGVVAEFQWTNPHVWLELDVHDEKGVVTRWSLEAASPSLLQRAGWKYNDLKKGDKVKVVCHPTRDGRFVGSLSQVTLPDGTIKKYN